MRVRGSASDDLDRLRDLEAGEALAAQCAQSSAGRPAAQARPRDHRLAPLGVGAAEDAGLGHRGMAEQGGLDLGGRDVLAAA